MIRYARAGERVYGTRTVMRGSPPRPRVEDYHHATVRHDIFIGELPDFPACLGDWQQQAPPVARHFIRTLENSYTTNAGTRTDTCTDKLEDGSPGPFDGRLAFVPVMSTATETHTKTTFVDLADHGGGAPPEFGVPWNGESWWRLYEHEVGGDRASVHYDLRFRGPDGTSTWRMDELKAKGAV